MLYVFCVECHDKTLRNKRYNAYSVVTTNGKGPRVDFAFACQPWAIKGTTRTELRDETIVKVTLLIIKGVIVQGKQSLSPSPSPKREGSG